MEPYDANVGPTLIGTWNLSTLIAISEDILFLLFSACRAELSGLKERAREMLLAQGAELSRYI
jgi:hypothetical protein